MERFWRSTGSATQRFLTREQCFCLLNVHYDGSAALQFGFLGSSAVYDFQNGTAVTNYLQSVKLHVRVSSERCPLIQGEGFSVELPPKPKGARLHPANIATGSPKESSVFLRRWKLAGCWKQHSSLGDLCCPSWRRKAESIRGSTWDVR